MPARIDRDVTPNELELLGQDILRGYFSHDRFICIVDVGNNETETIALESHDLVKIMTETHMFAVKARRHFHIQKVSALEAQQV